MPTFRARRVESTIALRPELELTMIARDIDENPIAGAVITHAYLCGQFNETMAYPVAFESAPTDEDGTVVLPNLGRESMTIAVRIAGRTLAESKVPYDAARHEVVLTIR